MYVFRMRPYKVYRGSIGPNQTPWKIEAVTETLAQGDSQFSTEWIYFFVDLTAPEAL
jgi:hypothetical protein